MAKFLVEPEAAMEPKRGVKAMIVDADDAAGAKLVAAAYADGDGPWSGATVTALAAAGAADYAGFKVNIRVSNHDGNGNPIADLLNYSYTAIAAATVDSIGAAVAAELAALGGKFVGAAYDAPSNTLKVAALAQGVGDHKLAVTITPPTCSRPVASLVGAITDGGVAAADLTVVLAGPAAIPCVQKVVR